MRAPCLTRRATAALLLAAAAASTPGMAAEFADPLVTPARLTERALRAPVLALAQGGAGVLLGVGPRGHILRSSDSGRSWVQVPCPVSTDLVAVAFAGATTAWAVGHDGVMLQSTDAGATWRKRLDGFALGQLLVDHYTRLAAAQPMPPVQRALEDARKAAADGAALSLLSVWFRNEREGFIVGQFNLILHTRDGGQSWQPWLERTENPDHYSLHAVAGDARQVWIVGELGLVLRLDAHGERFVRVDSPYHGSWFGLDVRSDAVLLFGLRGNAWRSDDAGTRWRRLPTDTDQHVNAGALLDDGGTLLLTARGRLLRDLPGDTLGPAIPDGRPLGAAYALARAADGGIAVGTARGVLSLTLPTAAR